MESFLKEQLERIQQLTERVSRLRRNADEFAREMENSCERTNHGPLGEVRDFRTYTSEFANADPPFRRAAATRDKAADSPRRRRRSRR